MNRHKLATATQVLMTPIARAFWFGGFSKLDTVPLGGARAGPDRISSCWSLGKKGIGFFAPDIFVPTALRSGPTGTKNKEKLLAGGTKIYAQRGFEELRRKRKRADSMQAHCLMAYARKLSPRRVVIKKTKGPPTERLAKVRLEKKGVP